MKRKTAAKRLRAKLGEVKEALMRRRHEPIPQLGAWLRSVVRGYFNYHGVPGNTDSMESFRTAAVRHWLKALRRRSQKHRMAWERFARLADRWVPKVQVLHPYPNERFYAKHPK